ncbi:MAG: hypothetical protein ABL876_00170 [Chitinophagaceae bacterium]
MSYLKTSDVQTWLQSSKYPISSVEDGFETAAKVYTFGEIGQRYDVSSWIDSTNTPSLVLTILAMQVAAYELRRAGGEEDGRTTYADKLEQRASDMVTAIVSGTAILPGEDIATDGALGLGPAFFPLEGSDLLDPCDPGFAPLFFKMDQRF